MKNLRHLLSVIGMIALTTPVLAQEQVCNEVDRDLLLKDLKKGTKIEFIKPLVVGSHKSEIHPVAMYQDGLELEVELLLVDEYYSSYLPNWPTYDPSRPSARIYFLSSFRATQLLGTMVLLDDASTDYPPTTVTLSIVDPDSLTGGEFDLNTLFGTVEVTGADGKAATVGDFIQATAGAVRVCSAED